MPFLPLNPPEFWRNLQIATIRKKKIAKRKILINFDIRQFFRGEKKIVGFGLGRKWARISFQSATPNNDDF